MAHVVLGGGSVPTGWKKEKQNPTQIAPQGAINYLARLYESLNPPVDSFFFFPRTLDKSHSSSSVEIVHTYIFILLFFIFFSSSYLISIVVCLFFLIIRSVLLGAQFRFLLNGSQDVWWSMATCLTTEIEAQTQQKHDRFMYLWVLVLGDIVVFHHFIFIYFFITLS